MKKLIVASMVLAFTFAELHAQTALKVYTSPKLPARETLDRMNLILAWNARVPVDGNRDGIYSLQFLPGVPNQLVAQTYKGAVHLYNAENGDLLWKTQIGVPYWVSQPVAFNSQSIFVARRDMLHVLNRQTGAQRVYSYEAVGKVLVYGFDLHFTPSAPLAADEEFLYVCMGGRINAFAIPDFESFDKLKRARAGAKEKDPKDVVKESLRELDELPAHDSRDSLQPLLYWGFTIPLHTIDFAPLFSGDQISILTTNGVLTSVNRFDQGPRKENYEFKFNGPTLAAGGQHRNIAYIGSEDFTLYAVEMMGGKLLWRHLSGSPIARKPLVNDRDIFIAPSGVGLRSLDRMNGRPNWTNRETQTFLATNNQYVYALDKVGRFFVLDGRRGGTLAKVDFSQWTISIQNEWTDRVYLAANDGQIICLRHRDLSNPLILKITDPIPKPKEVKKKEEKKEEMEKEDIEKKDVEKKDLDKKDLEKKDLDKKDLEKKDLDKKDPEKKDLDKKDAARAGRLSWLIQRSTWLSARLALARRSDLRLTAADERREWASQ